MFALKIDNRKYIGHTATLPCPVVHGTASDTNVRIGHLESTTLVKRIEFRICINLPNLFATC